MQERQQLRSAVPLGQAALIGLTMVATLLAALSVNAAPRDPARIAAFFPPWWSQTRIVEAAASAGQILGGGGAPFVVILHGDPLSLARHARDAGAWVVTGADPAGLCSPIPLDPRP